MASTSLETTQSRFAILGKKANALRGPLILLAAVAAFGASLALGPEGAAALACRGGTGFRGQQGTAEELRFRWAGSGRRMSKDGAEVSFSHYKSQDGLLVERAVEDHKYGRDADAAMERLEKRARKVLERGSKQAWDGHRIGQRVVVILHDSPTARSPAAVAWTDGARLFIISSPSLRHCLAFEAQDYPAVRPNPTPPRPTAKP